MKKLLLITILSLFWTQGISQNTFTCSCTYIESIEWDLAGSDIKFKNNLGDTISFVVLNGQNIEKDFYQEFWDESRTEESGGGIIKTTKKNAGKTYLIVYKHLDADGEGGMTEYNQVINFKQK